ncbi:MAG: response regulator [Gammaproteobacteria bacterium]|nr:response regulator [Gammaproteobacteria bacterium]
MVARQAFLIDDSKSARIVLSRLLSRHGFDEVVMAESGEQALELLKDTVPDAIFVDYQMDGMDGLETIAAIKKDQRLAKVPIFMCTANEGADYATAAQSYGAMGILTKPPTTQRLKEIIELIDGVEGVAVPAAVSTGAGAKPAAPAFVITAEEVRTIAREAAQQAAGEVIGPLAEAAVEKRLAERPLEIDVDKLREEIATQVSGELEGIVRQVNDSIVAEVIETHFREQWQQVSGQITQQLEAFRSEVLGQVPEKNDMIEHIRMVTEGSMEALATETATRVSQEVAHHTAIETAEALIDHRLSDEVDSAQSKAGKQGQRTLLYLGITVLLLAVAAGLIIYN